MIRNRDVLIRETSAATLIVGCWGNIRWAHPLFDGLGKHIAQDIYCFGKTKSGAPIHPMTLGKLRVPDSQQPILWRAANR